jgi:hypothetical protein
LTVDVVAMISGQNKRFDESVAQSAQGMWIDRLGVQTASV